MSRIIKNIDVFGTLDNSSHPTKIKDSSLVKRENFRYQLGDYGVAVFRNAFNRYNTNQLGGGFPIISMFEARLSSGTNYLMAVISNGSSSKVIRITSPYTGTSTDVSATSADENYALQFAQIKDKVYRANRGGGAAANFATDFTNDLEVGVPPMENSGISVADNGVGNLTGNYRWAVTYVYGSNMESGISTGDDGYGGFPSGSPAAKKVQLQNIPLGNAYCTSRRIYRASDADYMTYYYVGSLADNTSTTFDDNVPDAELGLGRSQASFFTFEKPYKSKYIAVHNNRMIQGYLKDNHTNAPAMVNGDLSLRTGTDLDLNAIYKYRIFKILGNVSTVDSKQKFVLSKPVELTITTTTQRNVRITFPAAEIADEWYRGVVIQRTEGGGSAFYNLTTQATMPATFDDTAPDSSLVANSDNSAYTEIPQVASDLFPSRISVSAVDELGFSQPDLVETTIEIGESDDQEITGIWSTEYALIAFRNRSIYRVDTNPDSTGFWKATSLFETIGSDAGMQCRTPNGFVFVKTSSATKDKMLCYEWNFGSEPRVCTGKIQTIINALSSVTVRDIDYNSKTNRVSILIYDGTLSYKYEYDLNVRDENGNGEWNPMFNATDLNLRSIINPVNYDELMGSGIGYLMFEDAASSFRDYIAGSSVAFTGLLKTKKYEFTEGDLMPRRFRMITEGSTTGDMTLKYAVDNGSQTSKTLTGASVSGIYRVNHTDFSGANDRAYRNIDFQIEWAGNGSMKIHNLFFELRLRHMRTAGR
jgi:hypothetical protein